MFNTVIMIHQSDSNKISRCFRFQARAVHLFVSIVGRYRTVLSTLLKSVFSSLVLSGSPLLTRGVFHHHWPDMCFYFWPDLCLQRQLEVCFHFWLALCFLLAVLPQLVRSVFPPRHSLCLRESLCLSLADSCNWSHALQLNCYLGLQIWSGFGLFLWNFGFSSSHPSQFGWSVFHTVLSSSSSNRLASWKETFLILLFLADHQGDHWSPVQWRFSGKRNTRSDKMTTDQWIKFLFRNVAWPKKEGVCQQNHFGVALDSLKEG